jgi:mono/diheme cytochrome c family protein
MKKTNAISLGIILGLALVLNCGKKEEPAVEEAAGTAGVPAELAKGEEIFAQNCASCHGEKGHGDGAASASLNPKPRNFQAPASEWKNGNTLEGITKTLNNGIAGGAMVAYKHLGDDSINEVAKYVVYLTQQK